MHGYKDKSTKGGSQTDKKFESSLGLKSGKVARASVGDTPPVCNSHKSSGYMGNGSKSY